MAKRGLASINAVVCTYVLVAWAAGVWLLTRPQLALNVLGMVLVAHALICSAYLIHECVHQAACASARGNDRLGIALGWLNGACVASYARLKKKHLRHHSDRLDVVTFDYRAALRGRPAWLQRAVLALEWAYIPAVELMVRGMIIAAPFRQGGRAARARVIGVLAVRVMLFGLLGVISLKALLLYGMAYGIFLTVMRFLDAYQHTYEIHASQSLDAAAADPRRDLRYEYENTYSNLLSERWAWANLLVLNFPYHNAHHVRPNVPWYRLPDLHLALYGTQDRQVLCCRALLVSYHRHRVARVLADDYGVVAAQGDRAAGFLGAIGVSFLTAV